MPTAADGFLFLLEELEHSTQPEDAKAAFRELINRNLDSLSTDRERRVRFARHLLALGTPRATIRERLQMRFSVERAQAYRDIDQALQTVPWK